MDFLITLHLIINRKYLNFYIICIEFTESIICCWPCNHSWYSIFICINSSNALGRYLIYCFSIFFSECPLSSKQLYAYTLIKRILPRVSINTNLFPKSRAFYFLLGEMNDILFKPLSLIFLLFYLSKFKSYFFFVIVGEYGLISFSNDFNW